jgi:hypothetical protein
MLQERKPELARSQPLIGDEIVPVETLLPAFTPIAGRNGFYVDGFMLSATCSFAAECLCQTTKALLRPDLTENHFIDQAKRSVLLDLACMKRCSRDVKSRVFRNVDHAQVSSIESPLGLLKGESHRLGGSRCGRDRCQHVNARSAGT